MLSGSTKVRLDALGQSMAAVLFVLMTIRKLEMDHAPYKILHGMANTMINIASGHETGGNPDD